MDEILAACPVCHEDDAYIEEEGGWCVYVACATCGSQTAFCRYENEEEHEAARQKAVMIWNMGKVIAEKRGE